MTADRNRRHDPDDDLVRPRRARTDALDDAGVSATEAPDVSGQGSGPPIPTESISFNFGAVEMFGAEATDRQGIMSPRDSQSGLSVSRHNDKGQEIEVENDETHVAAVWDDTDITHVVADAADAWFVPVEDSDLSGMMAPVDAAPPPAGLEVRELDDLNL